MFRFKQFEVRNSASAMKVGTDGVLLGAWMPVAEGAAVLDVGAGCGLISLMAAQRGAARVVGVEIDAPAAAEAAANVERSPWSGDVVIVNDDFFAFAGTPSFAGQFNLIVSNPPFFAGGVHSPDASRLMARHGVVLDFGRLIPVAEPLLAPGGSMALISPADRADDIEMAVALARMYVLRRCEVSTKPGKAPVRILWEIAREGAPCVREALTVGSGRYKELTSAFYLDK